LKFQAKNLRVLAFFSLLALACSTDLFKPAKPPVITRMEASAYEIDPGMTVQVSVSVDDDDAPVLVYRWSADGGQFIPPVDQSAVAWKAPAAGGNFVITVEVSNEKKSAGRSITVTVRSFAKPGVEILSPKNGDYVVQHETLFVRAVAAHSNGINHVDLFIRDILKETRSGHSSGQYDFAWPVSESAGPAEIKIEATANATGVTGRDSVRVTFEGIVLGK
jgi:hypothetical protein